MDGLFKKTMSYLNSEVVQDEFVGKIVEVAAIKLKILRKIAEGKRNFHFFVFINFWRPTAHIFFDWKVITIVGVC